MAAGPYVPRTAASAPSRRHTRKHRRSKHGLRAGLPQTLHTMGLAESPLPRTIKPPQAAAPAPDQKVAAADLIRRHVVAVP